MPTEAPEYFDAAAVLSVLTWPMVNEAVEQALFVVSQKPLETSGEDQSYATQPQRTFMLAGSNSNVMLTMPGFVSNYKLASAAQPNTKLKTLACKLVTSFPSNARQEPALPRILANILLFCTQTGRLQAIIEATQITAWRTAAASIVSTKYLYFQRLGQAETRPITLAIIGCGVQGRSHALGMCLTYHVAKLYLWNRTAAKAEQLAADLRLSLPPHTQILVVPTAANAVAEADVICVGTNSPVALFDYAMLPQHSVHINTVGAGLVHFGEVAQDIYDQAIVYVDSHENAKRELIGLKAHIAGEVGEVIKGTIKKPTPAGLTIFQSMGE